MSLTNKSAVLLGCCCPRVVPLHRLTRGCPHAQPPLRLSKQGYDGLANLFPILPLNPLAPLSLDQFVEGGTF